MALGPILAIANRGEIAIRIARTARRLGWQPVALLGDPDLNSLAAREIGRVEPVGPAGSELNPKLVIRAAERSGAVALHPGYGFLSERPELSQACLDHNITFVGPSPATLALCGDKIATREVAVKAGVPLLPASEPLSIDDPAAWQQAAAGVGFPLIAKIAGGGGGRGLRVAASTSDLQRAVESAVREAGASGAGQRLYLERYLEGARHVEVQVAGDGSDAVALGDRDCSIQRRHQKVIEEAPAFGLSDDLRAALHVYATTLARAVGLLGVATVEFLLGRDGTLAFLEINPRLQVEHTVTEEVTGLDLVEVQLNLAQGGPLPAPRPPTGHAIQARLYAEDPLQSFAPSPGTLAVLDWPRLPGLRVDSGYEAGDTIPDAYDSMIAKIIVHAPTRAAAVDRLSAACALTTLGGTATNRAWLYHLAGSEAFATASHDLSTVESFALPAFDSGPPGLAALAAQLLPSPSGSSAWDSSGPFRLVAGATQIFHGAENGGWQQRLRCQRASGFWRADPAEPGSSPRPSVPTAVIPHADGFEISSAHGRWLARVGARPHRGAAASHQDGALRAPMPGTVVAVNVAPGATVAADDVLVVMTAMKIEIALTAPYAGTVVAIGCATGDLVSSRQLLVTVEPAAKDDTSA